MDELKNIMQPYINSPIWIEYGCNGTGYSKILIVQDNQIVEIAEFLYSIWRNNLWKNPDTQNLLIELAKLAEEYRLTKTGDIPILCYYCDELCVNTKLPNKIHNFEQ